MQEPTAAPERSLRGCWFVFFFNLELCKHHLKAIYILHLSLLLTGASAGGDVQCAAVIYDLAPTFDLCRVKSKQTSHCSKTSPQAMEINQISL